MNKAFLLLALPLALLMAACGSSDDPSTPSGSGGGGNEEECTHTMRLLDFKLDPSTIETADGHLEICVENAGKSPHDLAVRDGDRNDLGRTPVLSGGDTARLSLDLEPGEYAIYCSQAGHESLGMKGTLSVTE